MKPTLSTWSTLLPFLGCIYKSYSANSLADDPIVEQLFRDGVKKKPILHRGATFIHFTRKHILLLLTYTNARWILEMGITIIEFLFIVLNVANPSNSLLFFFIQNVVWDIVVLLLLFILLRIITISRATYDFFTFIKNFKTWNKIVFF